MTHQGAEGITAGGIAYLAESYRGILSLNKDTLGKLSQEQAETIVAQAKSAIEKVIQFLQTASSEERKNLSEQTGLLLMIALSCEQTNLAHQLIQLGADIHIKTDQGRDPLCFAALCGNAEIYDSLKNLGATTQSIEGTINDFSALEALPKRMLTRLRSIAQMESKLSEKLSALDSYYYASRFGHSLGLSENISVHANGSPIQLAVQGNFRDISLRNLYPYIGQYSETPEMEGRPEKQHFQTIEATFKRSVDLMDGATNDYIKDAHNKLFEDYQKGQLVYIASGFLEPAHTVAIALYGNHLIYCNRGRPIDGSERGGDRTTIYEIPNGFQITPEFLKSLYGTSNPNPESLKAALKDIVKPENLVAGFPTKKQEHGNCSFANPKAIIEAMLLILKNDKQDNENLKKLVEQYVSDENRGEYKNFTKYIRDQEIVLIKEVAARAQTGEMKEFCINLVRGIMAAHAGGARDDNKKEHEIQRLIDLIDGLPEEMNIVLRAEAPYAVRKALTSDGGLILESVPPELQREMQDFKAAIKQIQKDYPNFSDDKIDKALDIDSEKSVLTHKDVEQLNDMLSNLDKQIELTARFDSNDPELEPLNKMRSALQPLVDHIAQRIAKGNDQAPLEPQPQKIEESSAQKIDPPAKVNSHVLHGFKNLSSSLAETMEKQRSSIPQPKSEQPEQSGSPSFKVK